MSQPSRTCLALLAALLLSSLALAGCGGDSQADAQPGNLTLTVTSDPSPPTTGRNTLFIEVKNAGGTAMTSAQVAVNPQMPSMGHGSTETPVVTEMGSGRYQAYPVTFQMPGTWEVTVTATAGADTGTTKVTYDVR